MKNKIVTFSFIVFISLFSIFGIVLKDEEISKSERRKLATLPEFKLDSNYVSNIEKYFLDHFPLRETLRSIKAKFNYHVLQKLDNNKIFMDETGIYKSDYPTNQKSIDNFMMHLEKTSSQFSYGNNVYVMIVPDKNYYLEEENFLKIDYDKIYDTVSKDYHLIDLRNILFLEDYYETDTHWRQERLDKVVYKMSKDMKFRYKKINYQENVYDKFYGVYYGEAAVDRKPDKLVYLTNENMDNLKVSYLENKELKTIYNVDNLEDLDSYEVYLDGASSFIEIINENCESDKELVIFRDSFGSSITPLLTPYYKKITVIDNRYISSANYNGFIDFTNQDVLFLYSTMIVNNNYTLKN